MNVEICIKLLTFKDIYALSTDKCSRTERYIKTVRAQIPGNLWLQVSFVINSLKVHF